MITVTREHRRSPQEYEAVLDDFESETERLRNLVENLLQLARSDNPGEKISKRVDLSALVDDVIAVISPLIEAKELELICDIQYKLEIMGDSDNLLRLFMNLLDNAIKYTEHGKISVRAQKQNEMAEITIADTGIGISEKDLPYVFDRFYRVDRSRSSPGNGLGLSIVYAIVQAHQGRIQISSELGKGTSLKLELPLIPVP